MRFYQPDPAMTLQRCLALLIADRMCLATIVYHAVCCRSMNKSLEKDENR
jgi:hypothetical protein